MSSVPVLDVLAVTDWRRQVAETYAEVRRRATDDPADAHAWWVRRRDELFADHPASPLPTSARVSFTGLDVAPYDPAYRFEVRVRSTSPQRMELAGAAGGPARFDRVGRVGLPDIGEVSLWSLQSYGGGLFLPLRDGLAGRDGGTFGGGRYVLDTVKGADLGRGSGGLLVVDLNFAYNPSCAYDARWVCPLATRGNTVDAEIPVGEHIPGDWLVAPDEDHQAPPV